MWPPEPTIEDNGLDIDDWDQPLYRIYPKKRFLELLNTRKNGLVRPELWDDPMENFFLNSVVRAEDGTLGSLESIKAGWYGQCWTTNPESDAMWRIYSPQKEGIKVQTTVRKLFETIYDTNDTFRQLKYFVGKVSYQSRTDIEEFLAKSSFTDLAVGGQADKFARTLCVKRPEFEHEQEVRLLYQDADTNHASENVILFDFDHAAVIDEVVIDPRMSETEFNDTKTELETSGCTSPIVQSDLYKISQTIIKL